ncbi:MAG: M20/M25/M40 family metallo-hydrolase [Anaerolineaceae bacterium]|nr:M20/M25/M40 family metallo-hydrolase [Anaerolineaceae bacterium]
MPDIDLLKNLSEAFGVSGQEAAVRKIVLSAIKEHVTDIHIDSIGNLTAIKKGTGERNLRVMIAAHMDEIGFMVMGHDSNGLLKFSNVGGVDDRILPALRVRVGPEGMPGVILWTPIHKNHDQDVTKLSNLRIDIGVTSKSAAESKAKRGIRITFDSEFSLVGDNVMRGKAFDDRAGCALLIELLRGGPYPVDILAAFTVQEEIGLRGARIAAQRLQPDVAIVLETTTAHDLPLADADPDEINTPNPGCKQGLGPVLTVMDRSMITPPHLLNFLRQVGENHEIPHQLKTALGGGTDAGSVHVSNAGIPSMVISMPARYIHAPRAQLRRDDYDNTLRLVQAALMDITPQIVSREAAH